MGRSLRRHRGDVAHVKMTALAEELRIQYSRDVRRKNLTEEQKDWTPEEEACT